MARAGYFNSFLTTPLTLLIIYFLHILPDPAIETIQLCNTGKHPQTSVWVRACVCVCLRARIFR